MFWMFSRLQHHARTSMPAYAGRGLEVIEQLQQIRAGLEPAPRAASS
jgi:hypothetical protein